MSRPVPAATAALRVLRFLAAQATPVPAARIASAVDLPRSSAYHLLTAMESEGFVTHYAEDRLWGIGLAAH
ncbi:MAG TPA: helix-turn-helix domain-containing protein, partial [Nocardioidaceae bacterium]|nr:helix-turn-helix domain-containing protein [Nocardioidaceae bacterium]